MNDFNTLVNSEKPTLVDFWAQWCGPCRMMNPIIEEVKNDVGDSVTILKVDVDQNKEVAIKYGIRSIPTLILFKNGEELWRQSGVVTKDVLVSKVSEFV